MISFIWKYKYVLFTFIVFVFILSITQLRNTNIYSDSERILKYAEDVEVDYSKSNNEKNLFLVGLEYPDSISFDEFLSLNTLQEQLEGNEYVKKIRSVFNQGIWEYIGAGTTVSKFVGGIYFKRNHIGDPGDSDPFKVVSPVKQREALDFIINRILDKDVFRFPPELLNKLSPERHEDFEWKVWRMDRNDYPIHRVIKRIHTYTLYSLFDPRRLARVQDNVMKIESTDSFTMEEFFSTINNSVWVELYIN